MTAGHTGAGMAAAILRLGRLPGVDRPALAVQMITDRGPLVLLDIGANPDSTAGEPRAVRADGRDLRRAGARRRATRASRCCRSARRRARATPGSSARPSCSMRSTLGFVGNVEGKDLTRHLADVVVTRRGPRQRRDQVLRGPVDLHLRPVADRVPALAGAAGSRICSCARASVASAAVFDYEQVGGSPLLGVKGTVIITHGRAKRRMIGFACDVAATTARARVPELIAEALAPTSRSRRASRGPPSRPGREPSTRRWPHERTGLTVGQGVIAELVRLAAFEVPGVARVGHGGPAWRAGSPARRSRVRVRDDRVLVRLRIVARPGHALGPLTAQVRTAVAATVERLLGLDLGAVTVIVDGVGG